MELVVLCSFHVCLHDRTNRISIWRTEVKVASDLFELKNGRRYPSLWKVARASSLVFLGNLFLFLSYISNVRRERTQKPGECQNTLKMADG